MRSPSLWRLARLSALSVLVALYVAYCGIRLHNLQVLTDLLYQGSACAKPGESRESVRARLASWNYRYEQTANPLVDAVEPSGLVGGPGLRRYMFLIVYGADGRVVAGYPSSNPRVK